MPEIDLLAESSSLQKGNLNHQAIEDYVKTIYLLAQEEAPVSTSRIAEAREVKPSSVSSMIQRLAKLGLVDYQKHYGVVLTVEGERVALELIRHHRLIELYLIEALGYSWDEVHEEADVLEHVISEKLEERIARALGYPKFDPHGAPIPTKELVMPAEVVSVPLASLGVGDVGVVSQIVWPDGDGAMLRYVASLGLTPGTAVSILEVAPFEGPISIQLGQDGSTKVVGHRVATAVFIQQQQQT
jgi:DtxR family transcriptional regulator, Mn-dependent transcriptional regulator